MMKRKYQICSKCVMDTTDSKIVFDSDGVCDHCNTFYNEVLPNWHTDEVGHAELMNFAEKFKKEGEGRDFDCIIGLSGGLDSSYTAYVAKEVMGRCRSCRRPG